MKHNKDCEPGDNWKDCPACIATIEKASKPDSVSSSGLGRLHEYKLHWKGGDVETVTGTDIADAVNKRGYGGGAMAALDYWREVQPTEKADLHPQPPET